MIEQQPETQGFRTQHSEMLHNTRLALDKLLADQQTQQAALSEIEALARQQQEKLERNQARREALLVARVQAQQAAFKAEAARSLAGDANIEEMEQRLAEAKQHLFGIYDELQVLYDTHKAEEEAHKPIMSLLAEAQETLTRINERVPVAQSIYDETLASHRHEIKFQHVEALQAARAKRDKLRAQLAKADEAVDQAQLALAQALKPWPDYAVRVLEEYLDIADDEPTQMLERQLTRCVYAEEHAKSFDPTIAKLMSIAPPVLYFRNYGSPREQMEQARATLKTPVNSRSGISPDLWGYADAKEELERAVPASRQAHRRRVIEQLVYDESQEPDPHTGWTEANRTL